MKRIIVEGMDNTGKSTLIEHLHTEFHQLATVVNELGPDQDFDSWWAAELDRDLAPFVPLHDRFFYSELVYGYHLRGYIKATQGTIDRTAFSLRRDALLIFCRPPDQIIKSTLKQRPQMEGVIDRTDRLITAYDELMWREQSHYMQRFIQYDYTVDWALKSSMDYVERYLLGALT